MPSASYRELPAPENLAPAVVCLWERTSATHERLLVLPDGCLDIIWRSDGELFVAGPDLGPVLHHQAPDMGFDGIRLMPGTAGTLLNWSIQELCDRQAPLCDVWGASANHLADRLGAVVSRPKRRELLASAIVHRLAETRLDNRIVGAAQALATAATPVRQVASELGLGERQLHRAFVRELGYGHKTFARIMRFRRFLTLARAPKGPRRTLAHAAAEAGYADQAHATRECRELTGSTPRALLRGQQPRQGRTAHV